jgi:hypothetical protein
VRRLLAAKPQSVKDQVKTTAAETHVKLMNEYNSLVFGMSNDVDAYVSICFLTSKFTDPTTNSARGSLA